MRSRASSEFTFVCKLSVYNVLKGRNERLNVPNVEGASITISKSRGGGAPSRKECVLNGQILRISN